jgi:hypothetical protein
VRLWLCSNDALATQDNIDVDNDLDEAELDLMAANRHAKAANARAEAAALHAAKVKKRNELGLPVEEEENSEDEFDPFPDDPHPGMQSVDWKGEGIVASLLEPVDAELPYPWHVKPSHRLALGEASF